MSDYYLGEVRLFALSFAPFGWLVCAGQTLQITQYQALYALLGTHFGGNGTSTFNLPDLRGRAIVGSGQDPVGGLIYNIGQTGGSEAVTLAPANIPSHTHVINADNSNGTIANAKDNFFGDVVTSLTDSTAVNLYSNDPKALLVSLNPSVLGPNGSGLALNNMQPSLTLQYCIATAGIYPPRND